MLNTEDIIGIVEIHSNTDILLKNGQAFLTETVWSVVDSENIVFGGSDREFVHYWLVVLRLYGPQDNKALFRYSSPPMQHRSSRSTTPHRYRAEIQIRCHQHGSPFEDQLSRTLDISAYLAN